MAFLDYIMKLKDVTIEVMIETKLYRFCRHSYLLAKEGFKRLPKRIKYPLILFCSLSVFFVVLDKVYPLHLPQNDHLFARLVVDDQGRPLRAFADNKGVWRYPVTLDNVSPRYIEALLEYEDKWFWQHPGINIFALFRAAYLNIRYGKIISGGSTLSMQVARLLHPHSRTMKGKLYQILRTIQLEIHLSKREILTLYCNIAPFGGTVEGVQAASFTYLDKPAKDLTYAEAALLAVLPQSPTRLRPDLHNESAQTARNKVLYRMLSQGVWSQEIIEDALLESVSAFKSPIHNNAPLLSRRLVAQSKEKNTSPTTSLDQALKSNVIHTTINGDLQRSLEDYVKEYVSRLPNKTSAAIMVVENATANVKAYIGTADFGNPLRYGHVDMTQAIRSPGSTLKPFLYAMAMDAGLIHSHSLLADVPRTWGEYRPSNFNKGFSGALSATEALQRSVNLPAIDLVERLGPKKFTSAMNHAGVKLTIPGEAPSLAIILGGAGTSLEKLVMGYSAFANHGKTRALNYLHKEDETINPKHTQARYFFSQESAWVVQDILGSIGDPNRLRTHAQTHKQKYLAWKTGTSYGIRDTWAIGVNKHYTIGVWVGRPDGTPIPGHSGRSTAGPLLHTVADHLSMKNARIEKPEGVVQKTICWPLGTELNENNTDDSLCHKKHQAWIIHDTIPPTWHTLDEEDWQNPKTSFFINTKNGMRVNAECMASEKIESIKTQQRTVALWPKILQPWLPHRYRRHGQIPSLDPRCDTQYNTNIAQLKITGIEDKSKFISPNEVHNGAELMLKAIGGEGAYHWYVDGEYLQSRKYGAALPYSPQEPGKHQIVVVDDNGNTDKTNFEVVDYSPQSL